MKVDKGAGWVLNTEMRSEEHENDFEQMKENAVAENRDVVLQLSDLQGRGEKYSDRNVAKNCHLS